MTKLTTGDQRLIDFRSTFTNELTSFGIPNVYIEKSIERQRDRISKKMLFTNDGSINAFAVSEFVVYNNKARETVIALPDSILRNSKLFITRALEAFTKANIEDSVQENMNLGLLLQNWRFGPGASNEVLGTHFSVKITQDMTGTKKAIPFIRLMRQLNPHLYGYDAKKMSSGIALIEGSKLTTVPKNQETARTIAIEPSGNMALQLAAGWYLEGALRCVGLDIRDQQDKNKNLALRGSVDGSLATLDLSHASDLITPKLIELLFPPEWYSFLMSIRSENISLPDGSVIDLGMMSTMGNGFTFPLMTLSILALLYGYYASKSVGKNHRIDYSVNAVFGDDIIIPTEHYEPFVNVLEAAGLSVNKDKSFFQGLFRESCGGDYFDGHDITPFYVKSLSSDPEVYVAINQLLEWTMQRSLNAYKTFNQLISWLHKPYKPLLVPEWCAPFQGIRTTLVERHYYMLEPLQKRVRLDNHPLNILSVLGGYVTSNEDGNMLYLPRENAGRYHVVKRHLPRGYVDGRCPLCRGNGVSSRLARFVGVSLG